MLHLVTDQYADERDILTPVAHEAFEIRSLAGEVLEIVPSPASGWTHEQLVTVAVKHEAIVCDGAEGYLGDQWIGSTEI